MLKINSEKASKDGVETITNQARPYLSASTEISEAGVINIASGNPIWYLIASKTIVINDLTDTRQRLIPLRYLETRLQRRKARMRVSQLLLVQLPLGIW